jgi:hypothetical protein
VSLLIASPHDEGTAYAAVNRFRLDDLAPHIFRTHDSGQSWQEITRGLPAGAVVNAVREDPVRPGLLYAGTELGVFVSFHEGDDWQPLQRNLPTSAVRDLVVHGDDLVVGTHGRSFWILDGVAMLRQLAPGMTLGAAHLFGSADAYRLRRDLNTDTPLPPEEPAGQNPPDGATIDYFLGAEAAKAPVLLEILDGQGRPVRRFASNDPPERVDPEEIAVPLYWVRAPRGLSGEAGMHRFVWDLRYPPPEALQREFPIAAIYGDTPREPLGPFVLPGTYQVRLTAGGQTSTLPLTVRMDPRSEVPAAALAHQLELAQGLAEAMGRSAKVLPLVKGLRKQIERQPAKAKTGKLGEAVAAFDAHLKALANGTPESKESLTKLNGDLGHLYEVIEGVDLPPTSQAEASYRDLQNRTTALLARWSEISGKELTELNGQLKKGGAPLLRVDE